MPEGKQTKKKSKKDSQLVIRLHRAERDAFVELCDDLDTSAAREIRRFIKSFLREHGADDHEADQ
ncbi:MAG: hypothetical protein HRU11_13665 [Parvularculaceae bacterium]|nr:hypothetical protein [Parvularculaceae bacterium]